MAQLGMDPQAVLAIAKRLDEQGKQVSTIATTIDRLVQNAPNLWKGPDVTQFAGEWTGHRARLQAAGAELTRLATKARTNAQGQISTSEDYSGGTGAGGVGSSGGTGVGVGGGAHGVQGSIGWTPLSGGFSQNGSIDGVPVHQDGSYNVGAGASGNAHLTTGPGGAFDAGANGEFHAGAQGQYNAQIGGKDDNLQTHADGQAGVFGDGHASITHAANGDTTASADGSVFAGAKGSVTDTLHTPFGSASATTEGSAGAGADGSIYEHIGHDGVAQGFQGGAFAGASLTNSGSVHAGPFSIGGSAGVDAGVGGDAGASYSVTSQDVGFDVSGKVAEALGVNGSLSVHVNPTELAQDTYNGYQAVSGTVSTVYDNVDNNLGGTASDVGHSFESGLSSVGSFLGGL